MDFHGSISGYNAFAGGSEMLAGLLLFIPMFTTIGALVAIAVMSNVFVLNMCYDVPVKLYSFHLLLMAMVLAAPHLRSGAGLFFSDESGTSPWPQLFRRKWVSRAWLGSQFALCLLVTSGAFSGS